MILTSSTFVALMYSLDLEDGVALKEERREGFRMRKEVLNYSEDSTNQER